MKVYDLTMNLGAPNLNLPQVTFLLAMLCHAYMVGKQKLAKVRGDVVAHLARRAGLFL